MALCDYNPVSFVKFQWAFSWKEILNFYIRKTKEYYEKRSVDYKFITELAKAVMGVGGAESETKGLDNGEGLEEMSEDQEAKLRLALGDEDFDRMYNTD